ncbi:MAG: NUDIX hydrolase [Bacteroidales bacterium]|nr:NUDIX hydrolase [Bacteroidales bacterium]
MYSYKYPRPALTTDALVFGYDKINQEIKLLLIQRLNEPFKNKWAIPGGFVDMNETVEQCVVRELNEETGLQKINFEQLLTASKIDRDPRGRTISVVFWAITEIKNDVKGYDDAKDAQWFSIFNLPDLAFDHGEIISNAIIKLTNRIKNSNVYLSFFSNQLVNENLENIKKILSPLL